MGYDIHLVKTGDWTDPGNRFTEQEWATLRDTHGLADWAYFDGSHIIVKNPSQQDAARLAQVAREHGWSVQGDDGEVYAADGSAAVPSRGRGWLHRMLGSLSAGREIRKSMSGVEAPFQVGDRVKSLVGKTGGVVIEVDSKGNHGAGLIKVRFPDGSTESTFFIAHGFEKE